MDQANKLREYAQQHRNRSRVLAVTSGKGGVGKTSTSVNLAIALAQLESKVVVLDADLGLANVEVLLGLNSLYNLQHVVDGQKSIMQILVQGPGGIRVVPGSSGIAKLADMTAASRQHVLEGMRELQERTDFLIIDTMAGISQNAVGFAAAADEVIVVTTPEPSAIVDAYAAVKTIHQQRIDSIFRLIINMTINEQQAKAVFSKLNTVSQQYLGRSLTYLGYIPKDPHVSQGVMQSSPFVLRYPASPASKCMMRLASRLAQQRPVIDHNRAGFFQRFAQSLGLVSSA
jgi:flagellar biosynthesis protein FlhG